MKVSKVILSIWWEVQNMNKLLLANFSRMKKDKIFWIEMTFMLCIAVFGNILYSNYNVNNQLLKNTVTLDSGFFIPAMLIGIIASVFCSLFIGTEYSDGTIRNKIIVGHSRTVIYFSNLIVCIIACILMCLVFTAIYTIIGYFHLDWFTIELKKLFIFYIATLMLTVSNCAIFTLISMLNHNKAISVVVCILLAFGMLFIGTHISTELAIPKTYEPAYVTDDGEIVIEQATPNPFYVSGMKRKSYEFINDFFPGGQGYQITNMSAKSPEIFILYSSVILVMTTGAGILIFRKKDLK